MGKIEITLVSHSAEETIRIAEKIGALLRCGDAIAYTGGMGAGKTTFTRGLATGMGLGDDVTSPTFALVNEYTDGRKTLYHFDMYRIENIYDLETTGFYDYPLENSVFAVEWSENISDALPPDTIFIDIQRTDENERRITLKGDERFADIGD